MSYRLEPKPEELRLLTRVQKNGIAGSALEKLWVIREGLKEIKVLFDLGEFDSSLTSLDQVVHRLESFEAPLRSHQPHVTRALHKHLEYERNEINSTIIDTWNFAVCHRTTEKSASLRINTNVSVGENSIDFLGLLEAVQRLDSDLAKLPPQKRVLAPPARIESLITFIDDNLLSPLLDLKVGTVSVAHEEGGSVIVLDNIQRGTAIQPGAQGLDILLEQLTAVINYLSAHLREFPALYDLIIKRSATRLMSSLCNKTLRNLLPISEKESKDFEAHLVDLELLESTLSNAGWPRASDLQKWSQNFPQEMIAHRKVNYLDEIRMTLLNTSELKLSRVEDAQFSNAQKTEPVAAGKKEATSAKGEGLTEKNTKASDWDNDWNEEFDDQEFGDKDDQDFGDNDGWGLDSDDIVISDTEEANEPKQGGDDWGWGDEEQPALQETTHKKVIKSTPVSTAHEEEKKNALLCSISEYPMIIVSAIQRFIAECKTHQAEAKSNSINASEHISDMLALYRALSPFAYKQVASGVIQYNDLTFLLHELDTHPEFTGQILDKDRSKLVQLSHVYSSKELTAQQERLNAVLKQANGFKNCNQEQNLFACQATIERAINLFYEFSEEWATYASFPQRVKALGTLLEYLCSTIIFDIEQQDNISEEESMELTKLIGFVQQLEELFTDPTSAASAEGASSLTLYYTPSWIKFQYLAEILQSKLVDILYLYNHNSLVDFSPQELVNLIKALFAPSEHRRNAIEEIWNAA